MPPSKSDPKQKPKPSKEVLAMVKAVKAKKAIYRKREDSRHATALIVRQATEGLVAEIEPVIDSAIARSPA